MRFLALLLALNLSACRAEPRAAAYFEAHPDEAAQVLKGCKAGSHRGAECQNAEAAIIALKRNARMARYKKEFE